MKPHHIGYAVPDLERGVKEFEALGWTVASAVTDDVARQVRLVFLENADQCVELVAPLSADSPVHKLLQKGSGAPYHICYEVPDLEAAVTELKTQGFIVFRRAAPAPALENRRVVFMYARAVGVLELVEEKLRVGS